jgi:UDP-GlcNAc:undecaprenyl-phosphate GlcNAc-1-phosphate transferase
VVGLFAGFWVAVAAGGAHASHELLAILGGCAILFVAGLLDDLYSLGPIPKLAAQVAAALLVIFNGLTISGLISNDLLAGLVALVWLVGMTNAFNLLDNMDGLAATLAAIAALFFAIDAVTVHHNHAVLALSLALALACAGFLPFNLRPKRSAAVFMGDSGSQVLGFALAALGLTASWKVAGTTVATLLLPVLVLCGADPRTRRWSPSCGLLDGGPSTRVDATTPRTASSTTASPRSARSSCSP